MPSVTRFIPCLLLALFSPVLAGGGVPFSTGTMLPPLPFQSAGAVPQLTVALTDGSGAPVIAWTQKEATAGSYTGGTDHVYAARLGPQGWEALAGQVQGGILNEDARFNASRLQGQVSADGEPWLAWAEDAGIAHVDSTILRGWNGREWSPAGQYTVRRNLSDAGKSSAFAVPPGGVPFLVWTNIYYPGAAADVVQVARRAEPSWVFEKPLNTSLQRHAFAPAAAVSPDGTRFAAWLEGNVATSDVMVARQHPGGAWALLGSALNFRPGTYTFAPTMKLTRAGNPVVAWLEDDGGLDHVFVKRWNGTRWEALGGALNVDSRTVAARPALAVDQAGNPVVTWAEQLEGQPERVYARKWTGRGWTLLGSGPLNTTLKTRAFMPSVTVDGMGRVLVAWTQEDGVFVKRF